MVDLVELYVTGSLEIPDHETGGMLPTVGAYRLSLSIKSKRRKKSQTSMVPDRFRNRHHSAPLSAAGRPRQHSQQLFCVARERIFARRAKTNLPMCLKRREALSLGRFAEQVGSLLHLAAAEVLCKTAPSASFSGRTEKEGPARPERVPILLPLFRAIKKASVTQSFMKLFLCILMKRHSFFEARA